MSTTKCYHPFKGLNVILHRSCSSKRYHSKMTDRLRIIIIRLGGYRSSFNISSCLNCCCIHLVSVHPKLIDFLDSNTAFLSLLIAIAYMEENGQLVLIWHIDVQFYTTYKSGATVLEIKGK